MTRARSLSRLANTNAFTVDASQRVGIGSTQPDVRLDVAGDMNVSGTLTYEDVTNVETAGITTTGGLVVTGLGATIGGITTFFGDLNFGAAGVGGTITTLGHAEFAGVVTASSYRGDGSQLTGVDSSNLIDSGDTNRVAANTSGIVVTGIGTVNGNVFVRSSSDPTIQIENTDSGIGADQAIGSIEFKANDGSNDGNQVTGSIESVSQAAFTGQGSPSHLIFSTNGPSGAGALAERVRITHEGKVGIGTNNPSRGGLHIHKASTAELHLTDDNTGTSDSDGFTIFSTTTAGVWYRENAALRFATNNTERLRVGAGGSVHIGDNTSNANDLGLLSLTQNASAAFNALVIQQGNTGFTASDGLHIGIDAGVDAYIKNYENRAIYFATGVTNTEALRIDSSQRLLVATDTARSNFNDSTIESRVQIEDAGDNDSVALSIISNAGTTNSDKRSGLLVLGRTRGTSNGSTTVVVEDDAVGMIEFKGMDGTSFTTAALIKAQVDGSVGADDMPGRLAFLTTADGAAIPTERLRIDSAGRVTLFNGGSNEASEFNSGANQFVITNNGASGLTIDSTSTTSGSIHFADGPTGAESYQGIIEYNHNSNYMSFATAGTHHYQIVNTGNFLPVNDNTVNLGSASKRFANIFSADLQLSNEGMGNDVDGTWGQYTIQEGEDNLFLLNRRNGKTYKFVLEEVN